MLLRKFEIVVDTDEVLEYFLVFYDGYKWFDELVVVIGLDKEDDAKALSLYIMNLVNDKGYVVNNISVDGKEIFDGGSFNEKR